MKKICYIFIVLISHFFIISCESDFDELYDTDQRNITFSLCTDSLFASILFYKDNGEFISSSSISLQEDYKLRIMTYCYNSSDSLIYTSTLLRDQLDNPTVMIRHLQKDSTYHFVFIADVVKYDEFLDYYETWFQLRSKRLEEFYVYSDNKSMDAVKDILGLAYYEHIPNNDSLNIVFKPVTYNGYLIFNKIDRVEAISGEIMYCSAFYINSLKSLQKPSSIRKFVISDKLESNFVMPISLCCADSVVNMKMKVVSLFGIDSSYVNLPNQERRPFIASFDCKLLQLNNYEFL